MKDEIKDLILDINRKFYDALLRADYDLMDSVWLKDENAKCVHPGWPMLYGWESIKESWKTIFESNGPTDIALSDVQVQVSGHIAWVICIEKISHKIGNEIQAGFAQSTNLFELSGSSWRLVLHHASPVPTPRSEVESSQQLQ